CVTIRTDHLGRFTTYNTFVVWVSTGCHFQATFSTGFNSHEITKMGLYIILGQLISLPVRAWFYHTL
ncbi:MAG: hypothetical protein R3230_04115, partial [Nitrosopumilaceae archaeon]|nr:hypothetical protein [Nitrosopumilaceae archaeon]